jgi:membrane protein
LYLSSYILLLGAEFNSEVEHQTARDTTAEAGERPLGRRGAWSADHVADGPDDEGKEGDRGGEKPLLDDSPRRQSGTQLGMTPSTGISAGHEHPYVAARATNRVASIAGLQKVGMISAAISTIGLSLLRKRGREGAGAALIATAAGISLLKRKD